MQVTLCEAREKAPGMMRRLPQFGERLFKVLVTFLLDIEVGGCCWCRLEMGINPGQERLSRVL